MFRTVDSALSCDKLLCPDEFKGWGKELTKEQILEQAYNAGWHVTPCYCPNRRNPRLRWRHQADYCPNHWPMDRLVEDLPPL